MILIKYFGDPKKINAIVEAIDKIDVGFSVGSEDKKIYDVPLVEFHKEPTPDECKKFIEEMGIYRVFRDNEGKVLKIVLRKDDRVITFTEKEEVILG